MIVEQGVPSQLLVEAPPALQPGSVNDVRVIEVLAVMSQLAARIAHDINNPLAVIRNSFLLVRDAIPPDHPHVAFVAAIDREIDRLARFSRRLYESFDLDITTDPRPTMQAAAMEAIRTVRQPSPPVAIDLDLGRAGGATSSIPGLALRLVVGNVIQDVVDASAPSGTVTVRGDLGEDEVTMLVSGGGPDSRQAPRYGQGARSVPGLSIGILAQTLGARLEVTTPENGSTAVSIHLPLVSAAKSTGPVWPVPDHAR